VKIFSINSLPVLQQLAKIGDGYINEILIENDIAYISETNGGVVIINISNPD